MRHTWRARPSTTSNTNRNWQLRCLSIVNSTSKQKIHSNGHDILLGQRSNIPSKLLILLGLRQIQKSAYFIKHRPPSHHTSMMHEYLHKDNHSLRFVPPLGCINRRMGITRTNIIHEPGGPKSKVQPLTVLRLYQRRHSKSLTVKNP